MLRNMQVHLALEYTFHIALTIVVHGRLSVPQALKCLPKERCKPSYGETLRTFPYVVHCCKNSPQGLEHFLRHKWERQDGFVAFTTIRFAVIPITIKLSIIFPILGLRPTFKLGSDTTLSAPQFESPKCIYIYAKTMHIYAQNTRMVHRYIIKGPSFIDI